MNSRQICWSIMPDPFHQIGLLVASARGCTSTWYRSQEVLSSRTDWRNQIATHFRSTSRPVYFLVFFIRSVFWLHWLEHALLHYYRPGRLRIQLFWFIALFLKLVSHQASCIVSSKWVHLWISVAVRSSRIYGFFAECLTTVSKSKFSSILGKIPQL